MGDAATIECSAIKKMLADSLSATRRLTYSASKSVPAGNAGTMYPGSFDCEKEKNRIGTTSQMTRNAFRAPSDPSISLRSAHHTRIVSTNDAATNTVHGIKASSATGA